MKTRAIIIGCLLFLLLFTFGAFVFNHGSYPEKTILGEWKEISWVYDKVDDNEKVSKEVTTEERSSIANHLVIHEFENWVFSDNYKLTLKERNGSSHVAKWKLQDRGRILSMLNSNGTTEIYSVEQLSKDKLVLHFETDVHARGIVKITMKRIK